MLGIFGEIWSKLLDDIFGIVVFILACVDVAGGWSGGHSGSLMGFLSMSFFLWMGKVEGLGVSKETYQGESVSMTTAFGTAVISVPPALARAVW